MRLERIDSVMLIREYDYKKEHQWLRNAAEENARRPFRAIVSTKNESSTDNLLIGADIDPTDPPTLWIVPTSVHIERTPDIMAACVKDLLSQCDDVLFIDPYFSPSKPQHTKPLQKFLEAIASRGTRRMPSRIEYHSGNQDKDTATIQPQARPVGEASPSNKCEFDHRTLGEIANAQPLYPDGSWRSDVRPRTRHG